MAPRRGGRRSLASAVVLAELLRQPGVEEQVALRSGVGVLALHGGLEERTAEIARAVAERADASYYAVVQPADLRWHVPSHQFDPAESDALTSVLEHCSRLVSLHGYGRAGYWTTVLVGGGDRPLAAALGLALRVALPDYEICDEVEAIPDGLRGLDPRNPVNAGRGGGVQLELPPRVRGIGRHWAGYAEPGFPPPTAALVDVLAEFATASAA
jgi:phage replication-related protein YjqB (UPF0714/DUF867 family)